MPRTSHQEQALRILSCPCDSCNFRQYCSVSGYGFADILFCDEVRLSLPNNGIALPKTALIWPSQLLNVRSHIRSWHRFVHLEFSVPNVLLRRKKGRESTRARENKRERGERGERERERESEREREWERERASGSETDPDRKSETKCTAKPVVKTRYWTQKWRSVTLKASTRRFQMFNSKCDLFQNFPTSGTWNTQKYLLCSNYVFGYPL